MTRFAIPGRGKRIVALAPASLLLATFAFAQPKKSAPAPSTASSAATASSTSAPATSNAAPSSSATTNANTAASTTNAHTRSSALETAGRELAAKFPAPPTAMLVAGAALRSDEPLHRGDELFARVVSVVGGKFPNARVRREPTSLAQARALAGRSGGLLYLDVSIEKGKLRVVADVYPSVSNGWERLKQPLPEPSAHEFVEVPTDAELRGFLPPILLERASVHRLRAEEDVRAIACGDVDGDGALDIVLATDKRITLGHARGHRFVADKSVQIAHFATRLPTPFREPLTSLVITNTSDEHASGAAEKLWVGSTDVGAFALDASLAKTKSSKKMPLSTERGVLCATPDPDLGSLFGTLSSCDDAEKSTREIAAPAAHYDGYAWTAVVSRSGAFEENVTAVREPGGKLRLTKGDGSTLVEGVGAEIALADLDQDGTVEVVSSLDANEDAITIQSWDGTELRARFRVAAPGGVRALAICPPEDRDAPFVAAVVGSEVWLVR